LISIPQFCLLFSSSDSAVTSFTFESFDVGKDLLPVEILRHVQLVYEPGVIQDMQQHVTIHPVLFEFRYIRDEARVHLQEPLTHVGYGLRQLDILVWSGFNLRDADVLKWPGGIVKRPGVLQVCGDNFKFGFDSQPSAQTS